MDCVFFFSPRFLLTTMLEHTSACLITGLGVFLHSHLSSHPPISLSHTHTLSLSISTLIDFSLMFHSFFPSARPPSHCRLPLCFLRSAALASALLPAISDSLSSHAASSSSLLSSFVDSHVDFCLSSTAPVTELRHQYKTVLWAEHAGGAALIYPSPLPPPAQWS